MQDLSERASKDAFTRDEIETIAGSSAELRDRALFATLYLSCSRVGEIVRRLRKDQIRFTELNGRPILMFVGLYTEKHPEHPSRNVPVAIEREEKLVSVLKEYLVRFDDEDILYPISRQRAWMIMRKLCGQRCHYLRHTRLTHLITHYGLSGESVRRLAGWKDQRMLSVYSHLGWKDIAAMMLS